MLQEIRQGTEHLPEQRVWSALLGEVESHPRHLDREPEPIEAGWSKVQDELRTDAESLLSSELVYYCCQRILDDLSPRSAGQRPRGAQLSRLIERQPGDRQDPVQRPVAGDCPDDA